jgi:hypothetical protein
MDMIGQFRLVGAPLGVSKVVFVMIYSWLDKQTLKMVLTVIFFLSFFLAILLAILGRGPMT